MYKTAKIIISAVGPKDGNVICAKLPYSIIDSRTNMN